MQAKGNARIQHNILIVDPDPEFAGLVAQAISDADGTYNVTVVPDVQQAQDHVHEAQATQRQFDLLIVDVKTLGTGSMHMIQDLIRACPETKIVTMTAYHSPELAARIQQLDVYTHLVKPVAPSRFRRLVHNAVTGKDAEADLTTQPPSLGSGQQAAVERQLANLRQATGSTAVILLHTSGAIRAMDCLEPDLDAGALCVALTDVLRTVTQALAQAMHVQSPILQSYFGTTGYSICVYRLDDRHAVATLFGSTVREGQVWYAMREGIEALQEALEIQEQESSPQRDHARNDGFDMVERYFAQQATPRVRPRRSIRDRTPFSSHEPAVPAKAQETPENSPTAGASASTAPPAHENTTDPGQETSNASPAPSPFPAPLKMERLQIDEIDWEIGDHQDWDALVADTDQTFLGMSFEEAKQRGLLDNLDANQSE